MNAPKHRFDFIGGRSKPITPENDAEWLKTIAAAIATSTDWQQKNAVSKAMRELADRLIPATPADKTRDDVVEAAVEYRNANDIYARNPCGRNIGRMDAATLAFNTAVEAYLAQRSGKE